MQDIDFDEIDRAVSSTMSPSKSAPKRAVADDAKVPVTITRTSIPVTPRPTSGRFMDVVHPSSDMKPGSSGSTKPGPATTQLVAEPEVKEQTWPDPLDFHGFKDDEPSSDETPVKPLETPFLPDTKVEKRPLGAFSLAEPPTPLLEETTDDEPADEEPPVTEAPTDDAPEEAPEETQEVIEPAEVADEQAARVDQELANVPTSITQQYTEHPASDDNPSGAIFDTEAYHVPLAHNPKKSGALVVLWIVALIVLGGGIGALAYFFVLPSL